MLTSRRNLFPALALGGACLLPEYAEADTLFTSFAFQATGAPTKRTMPVRLAEVKNVLDFGAIPYTGVDCRDAFQAAVDAVSGADRGIIYFPPGNYFTFSPVTLNYDGALNIAFVCAIGVQIVGNFDDFEFKRDIVTANKADMIVFDKMHVTNSANLGGGVQLGSTNSAFIRDCVMGAHTVISTLDAAGNSSENILLENVLIRSHGTAAGSTGLIIGGSGAMMGCDFRNVETAVRMYGKGFHASGCRIENTNTAWLLGLDASDVDVGASGFSITSCSAEGNETAFDFAGTCSGFVISSCGATGHDASNSGYPTGVNNSQYGFRVRAGKASAGVFEGCGASSYFDQAAFSIGNASSRANLVFIGCIGAQSGGLGVAWTTPTNAYTSQFINCNIQPIWTYSQLPTGGNVFEGDEFSISDGNSATWGANVTAGGSSNRVLVRWNSANWTVVGK
jgi:hypothetical protein